MQLSGLHVHVLSAPSHTPRSIQGSVFTTRSMMPAVSLSPQATTTAWLFKARIKRD